MSTVEHALPSNPHSKLESADDHTTGLPSYASSTLTESPLSHLPDHSGPPPGHGESALPTDKEEEAFENIVDDWEDDPENARNWSTRRKWMAVSVISLYTFVTPLASSMMAPGLPEIAVKYNITNPTIVALSLSIFLLSFAIGPLILSPLTEMYGRTWVLHIANVFTLGFNMGCAYAPTGSSFIAFRFLSGFSGSAPIAIGGGSIGDLFSEKDRASAMAILSLGPLIGPAVGPVAGGFISQTIGVRYVFVIIAACGLVATVYGLPILEETYAPVLRTRRALKRLRDPEQQQDPEVKRQIIAQFHPSLDSTTRLNYLWINLSRPIYLLTHSFICFILSLYMAFMYGIYYLMFATFADVFHDIYGFDVGVGGLVYLGLGVGFLVATAVSAKLADGFYHYLAQKEGGKGKPEMRIPALIFGSLFVPVGVFWYGWSAEAQVHWIMPIIGSGIFGFGMMATFLPIQLYLVDTFTYAASAVGAGAVFRSLLGFAFPLFGKQMFDSLGLGGGNSLLGGLAIILGIPFPIWIYYKGEAIRKRSKLSR